MLLSIPIYMEIELNQSIADSMNYWILTIMEFYINHQFWIECWLIEVVLHIRAILTEQFCCYLSEACLTSTKKQVAQSQLNEAFDKWTRLTGVQFWGSFFVWAVSLSLFDTVVQRFALNWTKWGFVYQFIFGQWEFTTLNDTAGSTWYGTHARARGGPKRKRSHSFEYCVFLVFFQSFPQTTWIMRVWGAKWAS